MDKHTKKDYHQVTATPDKRTIGYLNQNLVSEYSHEMSVADGVNVGYDIFIIDTKVSKEGGTLWKGEYIELRERETKVSFFLLLKFHLYKSSQKNNYYYKIFYI